MKRILAYFLDRPNRFVVRVETKNGVVSAYLPNPGRLWEILLPGTPLLLAASSGTLPYVVMAAKRANEWILLHTHMANRAARHMLARNLVPGLEDSELIRPEFTIGDSRFDFLLERDGQKVLLEVKSCTLFGKEVAAFPDAVTARGKRHIEEMARLTKEGFKAFLLFIVNSLSPRAFIPDYHTDFDFATALANARNIIDIAPVAVRWDEELTMRVNPERLTIPWQIIDREMADSGAYMVIFELKEPKTIKIGSLGEISFRPAYYVYVGSAKKNLSARVNRHSRKRKNEHWHIDYLSSASKATRLLPIRTQEDIECLLSKDLMGICDFAITNFGASDCDCRSHLFGFLKDPIKRTDFVNLLLYYRLDRPYRGALIGHTSSTSGMPLAGIAPSTRLHL
ncbi:DNA/RNA nuclease SfsA [Acetomicrobium sp. S15 = DSM 107314]|uniref:DNA/RNA nuclease SfsA n=1 Tax=Acetomicrobium sp. S15 = DSM 107314 TaxID=2529858 RepID=UPI0018E1D784|nr:DNA/RNA nuclease SfsA [Acetomicrobium sp. S15 = DSM 107314]